MQLASYVERGPLMWMMHLHVNQKSDYDIYDDDGEQLNICSTTRGVSVYLNKIENAVSHLFLVISGNT